MRGWANKQYGVIQSPNEKGAFQSFLAYLVFNISLFVVPSIWYVYLVSQPDDLIYVPVMDESSDLLITGKRKQTNKQTKNKRTNEHENKEKHQKTKTTAALRRGVFLLHMTCRWSSHNGALKRMGVVDKVRHVKTFYTT